jgi:hypothetical protein
MAMDIVTAISNAVAEVSKTIGNVLATREVRHMRAAIDAAERYIDVNEGFGDNKDLTREEKLKLLSKLRKRFKKYN